MGPEERRERLARNIRAALANERPIFRQISFRYPPDDEPDAGNVTTTEIDGETPGIIVLVVRSSMLSASQQARLADKGFASEPDVDDPRRTIYHVEVPNASLDDLVTVVEWVHRELLGAPVDYDVTIEGLGTRAERGAQQSARGCSRSCLSAAMIVFWIIVAIALLSIFLNH